MGQTYGTTWSVPRIRGDEPPHPATPTPSPNVFPAYVGMSPEARKTATTSESVPRIRGDEPNGWPFIAAKAACSPHTWG